MRAVFAQPEDPFPESRSNLTEAQRNAREQLLKQEGFTVNVPTSNLSRPFNLLYGPDDVLWITEREGKNITRVDPVTGAELSEHTCSQCPSIRRSGWFVGNGLRP